MRAVAAMIGLVLLGCSSPPSPTGSGTSRHAIVDGEADDGHPAVVALIDAQGRAGCSGTLISERAVLTAAHCGVRPHNVQEHRVFFGADVSGDGEAVEIVDARVHPFYTEGDASHDLTILTLATVPPATPMPVVVGSLDDVPLPFSVELVGFGATGIEAGDAGRKRRGTARVEASEAWELEARPDPSRSCVGDSGGAVLYMEAGTQVLAGVISRGDSKCEAYTRAARVDAERDGFVAEYLAAVAPGVRGFGEDCLFDEHCDTGVCARAEDEPAIRYCSKPCSSDDVCGDQMRCEGTSGMCRFPLPTPGAMGSACETHEDCVGLECTDAGTCSRRCVADGEDDCPEGFACEHLSGIDFFCVPSEPESLPAEESGCSVGAAPTGRGSGPGWLLIAWLAVVLRLRHGSGREASLDLGGRRGDRDMRGGDPDHPDRRCRAARHGRR